MQVTTITPFHKVTIFGWPGKLGYKLQRIQPLLEASEALIHNQDNALVKRRILEHYRPKGSFSERYVISKHK